MRKDSILLNYYYSKLPRKALGGGPDASLKKGNSQGALNGYQLNQFGPGGATTDGCPPGWNKDARGNCVPAGNFNSQYASNDANAGMARKKEATVKMANQTDNANASTVANFRRNNPWAAGLSDADVLARARMSQTSMQNAQQMSLKKTEPKRSAASKAWAIASHPMTALKYKVQGQDIPENFDRGETNAFDSAIDIVNPASYINAGVRTVDNIAHPFSTSERLFKGVRDLTYNLAGDNAGWGNVLDATGIVGDAAQFIPVGKGLNAAQKELRPFIGQAKKTWGLTSDLPFTTRFKNAMNAGTTAYELPGIDSHDYVHHYFGAGMTPEEALGQIKKQKINAPQGALMGDTNMSLNSTPLYFQSAARDVGNFPVVRTGEFQPLNTMGFKGKRVSQSIPQRIYTENPDIIQSYNSQVDDLLRQKDDRLFRVHNDPSLSDAEKQIRINDINAGHKRSMGQIAPELYAMRHVESDANLFNEFAANYKPHLDAPINTLSGKTGLNFPGTRAYIDPHYGNPRWEAPTAFSVKGSFAPRYKAIGQKAGNAFLDNSNLKFKFGENSNAANAYDNEAQSIAPHFNQQEDAIHNMANRGDITEVQRTQMLDDIDMQRNNAYDQLYQRYPNGRPAVQTYGLTFNPRDLNFIGNVNRQVNPRPNQQLDNDVYKGTLNILKQLNPGHMFFNKQ